MELGLNRIFIVLRIVQGFYDVGKNRTSHRGPMASTLVEILYYLLVGQIVGTVYGPYEPHT